MTTNQNIKSPKKSKEQFRVLKWGSCIREADQKNRYNPALNIKPEDIFEKLWNEYLAFHELVEEYEADNSKK